MNMFLQFMDQTTDRLIEESSHYGMNGGDTKARIGPPEPR